MCFVFLKQTLTVWVTPFSKMKTTTVNFVCYVLMTTEGSLWKRIGETVRWTQLHLGLLDVKASPKESVTKRSTYGKERIENTILRWENPRVIWHRISWHCTMQAFLICYLLPRKRFLAPLLTQTFTNPETQKWGSCVIFAHF